MKAFVLCYALLFTSIALSEPVSKWPNIDKTIFDISNNELKWKSEKNGTLIVFTNEYCPYDKDWRQRLTKLVKWAAGQHFFVVIVNPNSDKNLFDDSSTVLNKSAAEFSPVPYVLDPKLYLTRQFRVQRTPTAYLFNADKKRVYYGRIDNEPDPTKPVTSSYLDNALQALINGSPLSTSTTSPLGCKITTDQKSDQNIVKKENGEKETEKEDVP